MATWTPAQQNWFAKIAQDKAKWNAAVQQGNLAKAGTLQPLQNAQYGTAISNAQLSYGQQLAQNAYNRAQSVAGFGQQHQQLLQQYHDMRTQMPYGANARGILGGGIWRQELQDAARNQSQQLGAFQLHQGGVLGQFDLMRQQLQQQRAGTVSGLRTQRAGALQQQNLAIPGFS